MDLEADAVAEAVEEPERAAAGVRARFVTALHEEVRDRAVHLRADRAGFHEREAERLHLWK